MQGELSYRVKSITGLVSGLIFLAVSLYAVANHLYSVWVVPALLVILILGITRIDLFYLVLLFFVPLSVQLRFIVEEPPADLFLPTEPMLLILLLVLFYRMVNSREVNRGLFLRPVSVLIIVMLGWMLVTSITSVSPLVSIKALLTRTWFVAGFYFISLHLFRTEGFARRSLVALVAGLIPVAIYNIVVLWGMGLFNQQAAHATMWPFFNDHTSFGAAIAFLVPAAVYIMVTARGAFRKSAWGAVILFLLTALLFSYSRAAWISVVIAFLVYLVMQFRMPRRVIIPVLAIGVIAFIASWSSLAGYLEENRQGSSANLQDHIISATNITTDASNLERINRWKAAWRMISERPVAGWGPGTYQFNYAPYQDYSERTSISTNFGDRGNAHSEYIGAAVDSGIPGTIIYIMLLVIVVISGLRYCRVKEKGAERAMMMAAVTGLVTYAVHGFLNNFLDTDKLSAPFWISIAIVVSLQIREEQGGRGNNQINVAASIDTSSNR